MINSIFVYGTLSLSSKQSELNLKFDSVIDYDYIKGFSLIEIKSDKTYLSAIKSENGIISGKVLVDCNLSECIQNLDEWEGDQYTRSEITTEVNKIKVIFYHKKESQ
jgi:gamma-glutamylcyclotransferase (GGCT)/AIG2-like uncharacterized protein YtfP